MGETLKERVLQEIKKALREKNTQRAGVLRLLLNSLSQKEKEIRFKEGKERNLRAEEEIEVLQKEAKKRKEAILQFKEAKREDLAQKEEQELAIIEEFLPEPLGEEELRDLVYSVAQELGENASLGEVIRISKEWAQGRATGEQIARIAKEVLGQR